MKTRVKIKRTNTNDLFCIEKSQRTQDLAISNLFDLTAFLCRISCSKKEENVHAWIYVKNSYQNRTDRPNF